jgi:hypothetical protein
MVKLVGHRQTKGTETDKPNLMLPRHISTLPLAVDQWWSLNDSFLLFAYAAFGRYLCDWGQFGANIHLQLSESTEIECKLI